MTRAFMPLTVQILKILLWFDQLFLKGLLRWVGVYIFWGGACLREYSLLCSSNCLVHQIQLYVIHLNQSTQKQLQFHQI